MPKEYNYLRARIKTEQCRLLDWAHVANLDEDETHLRIRASPSHLANLLRQQEQLLFSFGKLEGRYKPLKKPLLKDVDDNEAGDLPALPAPDESSSSPGLI